MKKNNVPKRVLAQITISLILLISTPVFAQDGFISRLYDKRMELFYGYLDFLSSLWVDGKILDFLQLVFFSSAVLFGICYFFCWILSFFIYGLFNPFLRHISNIRKAHEMSNNALFSIRSEISSINDTLKKLVDCSRDVTNSIEKINNKEFAVENTLHLNVLDDLNNNIQIFLKIHQENLDVQKTIMSSLAQLVKELKANPSPHQVKPIAIYRTSDDGTIKF